jgi:hypothetical protein
MSGPTIDGPISHHLGGLVAVLGRNDAADAYFVQASAACSRAGAKFWAARTNLLLGTMLARREAPRDAERARELLTSAQNAVAIHGYSNIERRAAEALLHVH